MALQTMTSRWTPVLTLAMIIPHRLRKSEGQPETPYGIAIAFAGLWLVGERFLNQFV